MGEQQKCQNPWLRSTSNPGHLPSTATLNFYFLPYRYNILPLRDKKEEEFVMKVSNISSSIFDK